MTPNPCPGCGAVGSLDILVRSTQIELTVQPLGTYSLSGVHMKAAAESHATGTGTIACTTCQWTRTGRLARARWGPDGVATGGHFVVDPD